LDIGFAGLAVGGIFGSNPFVDFIQQVLREIRLSKNMFWKPVAR